MSAYLVRLLTNSTAFDKADLYDSNGKRRPLQTLVKMSQASGIWNLLSDDEKGRFTESTGQLENGQNFIARKVTHTAAIPKTAAFVINAQGKKIYVAR